MAREDRFPGIRPRPTFGRQLDLAARSGFPAVSTVLLMLLIQAPVGIAGQSVLLPAITLGCVWFWSLFRPTAMPPAAVFAIGILLDLLGYLPLGVGALMLLTSHAIALRWRHFLSQQRFALNWLAFVPIAAAAAALTWGLVALLTLRLIPSVPALFQAALSAALYPALAIPLARVHKAITGAEEE
jgi:rod shape-determining protein MreD